MIFSFARPKSPKLNQFFLSNDPTVETPWEREYINHHHHDPLTMDVPSYLYQSCWMRDFMDVACWKGLKEKNKSSAKLSASSFQRCFFLFTYYPLCPHLDWELDRKYCQCLISLLSQSPLKKILQTITENHHSPIHSKFHIDAEKDFECFDLVKL